LSIIVKIKIMPHIPIPPPMGFKVKTNSSGNFVVSDEHKEGLMKMMNFFKSDKWRDWTFKVHIGMFRDNTEQWIEMKGIGIYNHLNGVYEFEVYGDDGRDILNGIRKCYLKHRGV
jgi:hypothetical protein